ncbi:YggT family protein [Janibacter massiliensis]|uniref:YggT family protein n=1 Tax=Janibacter massiliensis TaxID=2058291 RepID=UPI000D0EFD40|nr:YggT family protein [Janibacter massiliensis]
MAEVWAVVRLVLYLYLVLLLIRLVLEWIQVFARDWRPRGVVLVLAEGVYTATDPPLRALRKVIPPLRIGSVQLDLSFLLLTFVLWFLVGL